jgi:hypothetical protein
VKRQPLCWVPSDARLSERRLASRAERVRKKSPAGGGAQGDRFVIIN